MDGWRSTNHWKGSWMVRRGPKKLDLRWGPGSGVWFPQPVFRSFFGRCFFLIFADLDQILGGFERPRWKPKSIFGRIFSMFFLNMFGNRFFGDFFLFFSNSNLDFCAHSQCFRAFSQHRRFLEKQQKTWILTPFSEAETEKNQEKTVLRNQRFFDTDFLTFFGDFQRFCLDFGRPRAFKKLKEKQKKSIFQRVQF